MKIGLIIQGPVTSYGDGPNNSKAGFPTEPVIKENIRALSPYVEKIVLSTWEGSGLADGLQSEKLKIIENKLVQGFDFLNQRKQFVTTHAGVQWLKQNTTCTHALKIRTDQLVPAELIEWLKDFYESSHCEAKNQEDFIVFSEALRSESFYAGDFIFAGTINDLGHFCEAVLSTKALVHPSNACDYVLKWLQSVDPKFLQSSNPLMRSVLTTRNSSRIQSLWREVLMCRISLIPKEIYSQIIWRGKSMPEVLGSSIDSHFFFYEDKSSCALHPVKVRSIGKTFRLTREHWKRYLRAKRDFKLLGRT